MACHANQNLTKCMQTKGYSQKIHVNLRAVLPHPPTPTLLNRSSGITSDSVRHKPFPRDYGGVLGFASNSWIYRRFLGNPGEGGGSQSGPLMYAKWGSK